VADRRALVITSPGLIGLQDAPELIPGPGEVVARPVHTGICGTDLELVAGVVDPAYVRYPLVPGHEWSGIIEAVGPGVTALAPGQPVIAEGIIPDRVCAQCVQGHTNLCLTYDELGFTRAGAAADQVAGTAGAVERALRLARRGGRVVLIGLAGNGVRAALPIDDVVNNDLLISASFAYTSAAWAEVTALLSSGQIRLSPLVTHRFPLEAYEQTYQVLRESFGPRGKVILDVNPEAPESVP